MTHAEFLRRAREAGCRIDISGSVMFVANGAVTVKIDAKGRLTRRTPGVDAEFTVEHLSYEQASRLLNLPRR